MNVLLVYLEEDKNKYKNEIEKIKDYWEKIDFSVIELERTLENESSTGIESEKYDFEYMVVLNTAGFCGESTGGLVSYDLIEAIQIFMIYDGSNLRRYTDKEFALNQYAFVEDQYIELGQKNMHNIEKLSDYSYDENRIFDYVRKDCLEDITLPKKLRANGSRYIKGLMKKNLIFQRQLEKIKDQFYKMSDGETATDQLELFIEECKKIDSDMALYHMNVVIPLQKCLEILELENKMGYSYFSKGCSSIEEMCEKYVFCTDIVRTLAWNQNEDVQALALQWMVDQQISPAAVIIVIKTELVGEIAQLYQKFAVFYQCLNDEKARKLFEVYAQNAMR